MLLYAGLSQRSYVYNIHHNIHRAVPERNARSKGSHSIAPI
jgi:hypothetical protein